MPYAPTGATHFTAADERLMARVADRLRRVSLGLERAVQPGIDCYRGVPIGSDDPAGIVARQYDGVYQLVTGTLRVLKEGRDLRDVLPAGWLEP